MLEIVFYVLAVHSVASALLCVTRKSPVASALWLVSTMFALAAIYVLLNAQFIAAMQVLVYAGAVMVLFLFVIMLLNLTHEETDRRRGPVVLVGVLIGAGLLGVLLGVQGVSGASLAAHLIPGVGQSSPLGALPGGGEVQSAGSFANAVGAVARPMFETYLVPFEITSILLLSAAVGAVVLAKRKL